MTNKTLFPFIFIFILALASLGFAYSITDVLTEDFSFTEYSDGELTEFVYSVAPEGYPLLSIELQGYGAYEPIFYLYDVDAEKIIYRGEASYNEKVEYSFVPEAGKIKTIPKEYYLIVLSNGKDGSSFEFTYMIEEQNDVGLGGDAPKRFTDAAVLELGSYTANLGGGDEKDYYAFEIAQDETFTIKLASTEKERLNLELIESSYMTTINQMTPEEGIERTFTSTIDQTIWIGIEGSTPYTLAVESDAVKEVAVVEEEEEVVEVVEEEEVVEEPEKEGMTTNGYILLFIIIVGAALFGGLFLRAKITDKMKAKKAEKESKKKSKK